MFALRYTMHKAMKCQFLLRLRISGIEVEDRFGGNFEDRLGFFYARDCSNILQHLEHRTGFFNIIFRHQFTVRVQSCPKIIQQLMNDLWIFFQRNRRFSDDPHEENQRSFHHSQRFDKVRHFASTVQTDPETLYKVLDTFRGTITSRVIRIVQHSRRDGLAERYN